MSERLIAARYRTMERLGAGGMAAVWRAIDTRTGRDVAIKRLLPGIGRDPAARERLRREARAMSTVHHPNIVPVIDVVDDDGAPAIVMDRIDGVTLVERLRAGPLPEREALAAAIDVADALAAAHAAGFVHRDVKPGNILLAEDGRARLLDFGIAADLGQASDDLTVDGVVGTLRYLAPERLLGEDATTATDVWGVGVTLFEAVAGQPVFPATTLVERVDAAGRAVERPPGSPTRPGPSSVEQPTATPRGATPMGRHWRPRCVRRATRSPRRRSTTRRSPRSSPWRRRSPPSRCRARSCIERRRRARADDGHLRSVQRSPCSSSSPLAWRRSPSILASVTGAHPDLRPIRPRSP